MHFPGPGGHHPEIMRQVGKAGHRQRLEASRRQQLIEEARGNAPRRRRGLPVAGWFVVAVVVSIVLGLIAQLT